MACLPSRLFCSSNIPETPRDPSGDPGCENARKILDRDALLFHRIAFAQRNRVFQFGAFFPKCFEINRNTERRADFILATITATDRARFVIENEHVRSKKIDTL